MHGRGCFAQSKGGGESNATIRRTSGQVRSKEVVVDSNAVGGGEDVHLAGVGGADVDRVCPRKVVKTSVEVIFALPEQWMTKTGPQEALRIRLACR